MRICSPQLGLSPDATLGGEVYDREILTQLAGFGVEIEVLLPAGRPFPPSVKLNVTSLPLRRGYRWFVSNLLFVPYIGRAYSRQPFDLLRVHSLRFTGLAAVWARRLYRLPVPIVAHHHHFDRDRWTGLVDARAARAADLVLTGSRFAADQLAAELDVAPERIAAVYYGVATEFRPGPADPALRHRLSPEGGPLLLHVGSLKARKNLPVLLDAFRQVHVHHPAARLVLVGRGPDEASLRRRADELGLAAAVHFAGFVPEADKVAWYRAADLLVAPSLLEGFGLAVAEAMACGRPVVASRAGSLPEVVADGDTGLLVPPDDMAALAQAILRLLDDPARVAAMGAVGAARVDQHFRWERTAQQTLALYEEALCRWRA